MSLQLFIPIEKTKGITRVSVNLKNIASGEVVYIGMGDERNGLELSKWANPYTVVVHGLEASLRQYKEYIIESGLINDLHELESVGFISCYCKKHEKCHGDILIDLIKEHKKAP